MFDFNLADGFIFDCDGTLIDSIPAWDEAERDLFEQAGNLTDQQEDEIHAAPIEEAADLLHRKYGVLGSAKEVLAHLDGHLIPFYRDSSKPMAGAPDFVRLVRKQGIPCVVVSSSPRRYLEAGLNHIGILECFDELVTTDETGASKQDARIYERAVALLGCDRSRVWAVDDAPYAVAAMNAYGLNTICVGERTSDVATMNVSSLEELM